MSDEGSDDPIADRSKILEPEEIAHITQAKWLFTDEQARFVTTDWDAADAVTRVLEKAKIWRFHRNPAYWGDLEHTVLADTKQLLVLFPELLPAYLEVANLKLKQDAERREGEERCWQEGIKDTKQAMMICRDKGDADKLVELLMAAHIEPDRQGEDGKVVLAPVHALQKAGIEVKKVENEVASEDQQKSDAINWLKNKNIVKWAVPAEGSPLVRAAFTNGGEVSNTVESLLALQCTKDLKRLSRDTLMKDNSGLMLEVNADALKAVVPGVTITPFNHAQSTDREEDERRTGR